MQTVLQQFALFRGLQSLSKTDALIAGRRRVTSQSFEKSLFTVQKGATTTPAEYESHFCCGYHYSLSATTTTTINTTTTTNTIDCDRSKSSNAVDHQCSRWFRCDSSQKTSRKDVYNRGVASFFRGSYYRFFRNCSSSYIESCSSQSTGAYGVTTCTRDGTGNFIQNSSHHYSSSIQCSSTANSGNKTSGSVADNNGLRNKKKSKKGESGDSKNDAQDFETSDFGSEGVARGCTREVYRQPKGYVQHVFQWGIGNAFRSINANRFHPVHAARPKEVSINPEYFQSPHENVKWEPLNEAWEVFFYENFKKSAKPFPVKKFGIRRAKDEALLFLKKMQDENRLKRPSFDINVEGVHWDMVTSSWVSYFFDREGRARCRAFAAEYHGFEEAKELAIQRQKQEQKLLQGSRFTIVGQKPSTSAKSTAIKSSEGTH